MRVVHFQVAFALLFAVAAIGIVAEADGEGAGVKEGVERPEGEKHGFQAEVSKMLDIIINALYTNRAIFLREVISNASDALDKIRFLYLTDPKTPKNKDGEDPKMDIRIKTDKESNTLTIMDGGVGMTKEDLVKHLGSLGSSGTKNFVEKMKDSNDANLIGQFGVGFYSVFLVADEVRVATKHDDSDKQWVWRSRADGQFYIYEDPRGNTLGRGTEIEMDIKKDAEEFLDPAKLKEIATKYSEFIQFPIYVQTSKTEQVPKKKDDEDKSDDEEKKDDDEADVKDEDEDKKDEEETEEVTTYNWDLVNENKPIWQRKLEDIPEEDYNSFYKAITKDYRDPMYKTHFSAEGEVEFKSILFIPAAQEQNQFDPNAPSSSIRLYVRRVFITDEFKDLLPRYLSFIKGVVDSDDLPLNVSRELLQENRILKIIKKKLIKKALSMIKELADADEEEEEEDETDKKEDEEEKDEDDQEAEKKKKEKKEKKYPKFWEEFGRSIRLGLIDDGSNRSRLTKLLRYKTSKSDGEFASLDNYVDRMKEGQKDIYYVVGPSVEKIREMPAAEDAEKRGVEVIYMTDAIDEYVVGHLTDYSGHKLVNLVKETPKLGDEDDAHSKKVEEKRKERYQPLVDWFKDLLGSRVQKVILTKRRTSSPLIVSSPQHGVTANMARIMKGQALGDKASQYQQEAKRVLELNYLNPIVDEINKRVKVNKDDAQAKDTAEILFEMASIQSGFDLDDTKSLSSRLDRMLKSGLDLEADAPDVEEEEYEIEEEEEEPEEAEEVEAEPEEEPETEEKKEEEL